MYSIMFVCVADPVEISMPYRTDGDPKPYVAGYRCGFGCDLGYNKGTVIHVMTQYLKISTV